MGQANKKMKPSSEGMGAQGLKDPHCIDLNLKP